MQSKPVEANQTCFEDKLVYTWDTANMKKEKNMANLLIYSLATISHVL